MKKVLVAIDRFLNRALNLSLNFILELKIVRLIKFYMQNGLILLFLVLLSFFICVYTDYWMDKYIFINRFCGVCLLSLITVIYKYLYLLLYKILIKSKDIELRYKIWNNNSVVKYLGLICRDWLNLWRILVFLNNKWLCFLRDVRYAMIRLKFYEKWIVIEKFFVWVSIFLFEVISIPVEIWCDIKVVVLKNSIFQLIKARLFLFILIILFRGFSDFLLLYCMCRFLKIVYKRYWCWLYDKIYMPMYGEVCILDNRIFRLSHICRYVTFSDRECLAYKQDGLYWRYKDIGGGPPFEVMPLFLENLNFCMRRLCVYIYLYRKDSKTQVQYLQMYRLYVIFLKEYILMMLSGLKKYKNGGELIFFITKSKMLCKDIKGGYVDLNIKFDIKCAYDVSGINRYAFRRSQHIADFKVLLQQQNDEIERLLLIEEEIFGYNIITFFFDEVLKFGAYDEIEFFEIITSVLEDLLLNGCVDLVNGKFIYKD